MQSSFFRHNKLQLCNQGIKLLFSNNCGQTHFTGNLVHRNELNSREFWLFLILKLCFIQATSCISSFNAQNNHHGFLEVYWPKKMLQVFLLHWKADRPKLPHLPFFEAVSIRNFTFLGKYWLPSFFKFSIDYLLEVEKKATTSLRLIMLLL